jgi:hypothetical protein
MEYENNHASPTAKTGLGFGIAGTVLGLMAGGLNGVGLFGNGRVAGCEDHLVNRYEASQSARIAELETEVKLRDSNIYTDGKILELYKYVDGKFGCIEGQLAEQRVYNATNTAAIACLKGQVADIAALTKIVIPAANVCPAPMPMYNSWTAPTTPTTGG